MLSSAQRLSDKSFRRDIVSERKVLASGNAVVRKISLEDRDMATRRKIIKWLRVHRVYMRELYNNTLDSAPDEESCLKVETTIMSLNAEDTIIRLPSALAPALRALTSPRLALKEIKLRYAQAEDALSNLRRNLRVGAKVFTEQEMQTSGTGTRRNTRMTNLRKRYDMKAALDAERYRAARIALSTLEPDGLWQSRFLVLESKDVRPPGRYQDVSDGRKRWESEGRRALTWIWKVQGQAVQSAEEDQNDDSALQLGK